MTLDDYFDAFPGKIRISLVLQGFFLIYSCVPLPPFVYVSSHFYEGEKVKKGKKEFRDRFILRAGKGSGFN